MKRDRFVVVDVGCSNRTWDCKIDLSPLKNPPERSTFMDGVSHSVGTVVE